MPRARRPYCRAQQRRPIVRHGKEYRALRKDNKNGFFLRSWAIRECRRIIDLRQWTAEWRGFSSIRTAVVDPDLHRGDRRARSPQRVDSLSVNPSEFRGRSSPAQAMPRSRFVAVDYSLNQQTVVLSLTGAESDAGLTQDSHLSSDVGAAGSSADQTTRCPLLGCCEDEDGGCTVPAPGCVSRSAGGRDSNVLTPF